MQDYLDSGEAEVAPPLEEGEEAWYLPLFSASHPKMKDKLQIVFDSSAQCQGISPNSVLMTGLNLKNSLVGVLVRFRTEKIAIVADVEKMFYKFYVDEQDRNYLRFLWHKDNDPNKEIIDYRMSVYVFGNGPSPAVATYGLRKCVESSNDSDQVRDYVIKNFCVDDGLGSFSSVSEVTSILKQTQHALLTEGKLRLHKIASNSEELMAAFPKDDLAKDLKNLDLSTEDLPTQHSLGIRWDLSHDCFTFQIATEDKPATRRGMLSIVNRIFDPLGFLSPVTLQGKLLLRDLISETKDWDKPLTESVQLQWNT